MKIDQLEKELEVAMECWYKGDINLMYNFARDYGFRLIKIAKLAKERAKYDKDTYTALDKAIEELENGEE